MALELEKDGWSREWACAAVREIEVKYNPAGLRDGALLNQKLRDHFQFRLFAGIGLFAIGLVVTVATLVSALNFGGWIVVTFGSIISGAGMAVTSFQRLKRYPDRPLPVYFQPRDPKVDDPGSF
ncbi:hypothetical protein KBB96_11555 [Luteolibacter ambystomatis]|uniref:Uncharacterized protein n=1 Tax=Luteolibacter ambystomatis TaxID=2824561 RepID=A0A975G5K2_9BACT|nr:hypothetical protein [Luteolibacter ambystomatis]QUE49509.1 hypothetical protein KBB96_11555 [Luteolibacter ambystomatis]